MNDQISVPRELRQVLGTILNALDRDALEGKTVRGEMAQELRALLSAAPKADVQDGYRLVAVNGAFSDLMYYLDRASVKGYLDRLYDLVEPWEAFDYEYIENAAAPAQPQDNSCSEHPDAPHGFNRNASHTADRYVCDCEGWVPPAKPLEDPLEWSRKHGIEEV